MHLVLNVNVSTRLGQKASLLQSIFFLVSYKAALWSFTPGFGHNIQIPLSYGEVVKQRNLGVSEKDLDCWVSSILALFKILPVSMLLFFSLLCRLPHFSYSFLIFKYQSYLLHFYNSESGMLSSFLKVL